MDSQTLSWCSNKFSSDQTSLKNLCLHLRRLMDTVDLVYAFEYEALGLNPMFLDCRTERVRCLSGEMVSRRRAFYCLKGSSLWQSENGTLNGAISMKSGCAIHGTVRDAVTFLEQWVEDFERTPDELFVAAGLSIAFDMVNLSLAHLSRLMGNRLMRLTNPVFSGLPEYLGQTPEEFRGVQARIKNVDARISHLSVPHGIYHQALLNERADLDADFKEADTEQITELLFILSALEAFHCMKAFELRHIEPDGAKTAVLYGRMREIAGSISWEALLENETLVNLVELLTGQGR